MRLTLRTLLAYLDDALEPAEAKLIGQKVAESEAAQELIARIKQVTRRRRLTTPPLTGPGARFDPNTIAEYLDNVLPAEQVAELEETCLASDVHLAEVAACHQVLTLFLGEPVLVPPTARQRMYGLIRGREAIPNRRVSAPGPGQSAGAGGMANGEEEGTLLGLPLSRRDGTLLRWLVAGAAACLLCGAGIAIWMLLASGSQPTMQAKAALPKDSVQASETSFTKRQPVPTASISKPIAEPLPAPKPDTTAPEDTKGRAGLRERPETQGAVVSPRSGDNAAPAAGKTESKPQPSSPQQVLAPSSKRIGLGKAILEPPTVLLQRAAGRQTWQRLKPQTRIFSNDELVSLPGYRSELRLDSGVSLILWGNLPEFSPIPPVLESAVVLHANPAVDLDFTLDHGRVVLSNHKRIGPARIRLRFADEAWDVTLPDQNTEVAAELVGICLPYTKEPGGGEPELHVALLGLKGQAQIKIRYDQSLLRSPSMLTWDNVAGAARSPVPLPHPPDWWRNPIPLNTPMQAPLEGLTNRLVTKNIDVAIAEAKNSPDPQSRVLALRGLGAMGNYASLLDCLADDKHAEVRIVAIGELRHLLGLSAKNGDKLRQALRQKNYSDGQSQTILQLLHGIAPQDWPNPTVRAIVVDYLKHDKLAIRQLSHTLLLALQPDEGRKIAYDPAGDSESRERGYEAWKKLVLGGKPKATK
jgi:hypothetical protein